jgi:hypothetical protein
MAALCEVAMCQDLNGFVRLADLRTQLDLGALPPLVLRCSSGLSGASDLAYDYGRGG